MRGASPELKQLVVEASRALAHLDTDRLEELALSCEALNQALPRFSPEERQELARQASAATADLAVFARVLEATRSNLKVMRRLQELHLEYLEYGEGAAEVCWSGAGTGSEHGDD